jgi:Transcriptional regulator/sugar kinase
MSIIAIDFGGTNIKLGIIDKDILQSVRIISAESSQGIRPKLIQVKNEVFDMLRERDLSLEHIDAVGVAIPGIVNVKTKRVIAMNQKYNDAIETDFEAWAKEAFGLPVLLENDTKSAIVGEIAYGCAKGVTDAVLMSFGTGVGTAAVVNGELLRGKHFQAGCLGGHIIIDVNGPMCTCGNKGCLEAHAGTWALPAIARDRNGFFQSKLAKCEVVDYKSLSACMAQGDEFSKSLFEYLLTCGGAGAVNLIHAYDPEVVILSGGLMKDKDLVLPYIKEYVERYAWMPWGQVDLKVAENPDFSVVFGLSSLCSKMIEKNG